MYTVLMVESIKNLGSFPLNCKLQNYIGGLTKTLLFTNFCSNKKLHPDWLKFD